MFAYRSRGESHDDRVSTSGSEAFSATTASECGDLDFSEAPLSSRATSPQTSFDGRVTSPAPSHFSAVCAPSSARVKPVPNDGSILAFFRSNSSLSATSVTSPFDGSQISFSQCSDNLDQTTRSVPSTQSMSMSMDVSAEGVHEDRPHDCCDADMEPEGHHGSSFSISIHPTSTSFSLVIPSVRPGEPSPLPSPGAPPAVPSLPLLPSITPHTSSTPYLQLGLPSSIPAVSVLPTPLQPPPATPATVQCQWGVATPQERRESSEFVTPSEPAVEFAAPVTFEEHATQLQFYLETENEYIVPFDYLKRYPTGLDESLRTDVVRWIRLCCHELSLSSEVTAHSVTLFDRFLWEVFDVRRHSIDASRLQLVAITCLLIAAKIFGKRIPRVSTLLNKAGNSYSSQQVRDTEGAILSQLSRLGVVLPIHVMDRLFSCFGVAAPGAVAEDVRVFALELAELSLEDVFFLQYPPSVIAMACAMLSHEQNGVCWKQWLRSVNNMFVCPLHSIAECMHRLKAIMFAQFPDVLHYATHQHCGDAACAHECVNPQCHVAEFPFICDVQFQLS